MSWNYRIVRYENGGVALHEVYYDEHGNVINYTLEPVTAGDDVEDIISDLKLMLKDARKKPILDITDLRGPDEAA